MPRSYAEARVPGNDRRRLDVIHDDKLLAPGGPGHEPDRAARHTEVIGQELEQGLVGRPADRGRRDVRPQHAVDDAVDMVGPRSRSQSDGEADVGVSQDSKEAPQDAQHDQDDEW